MDKSEKHLEIEAAVASLSLTPFAAKSSLSPEIGSEFVTKVSKKKCAANMQTMNCVDGPLRSMVESHLDSALPTGSSYSNLDGPSHSINEDGVTSLSTKGSTSSSLGRPSHLRNENSRPFHCFSKLAVELQLMILKEALISSKPFTSRFCPGRTKSDTSYSKPSIYDRPLRFDVNGLNPNILATCKMMHREGLRMFYGENTFMVIQRDVTEPKDCTDFIPRRYVKQFLRRPLTLFIDNTSLSHETLGAHIKKLCFTESASPIVPYGDVNYVDQNISAAVYTMLYKYQRTIPVTIHLYADSVDRVKYYIRKFQVYEKRILNYIRERNQRENVIIGKLVVFLYVEDSETDDVGDGGVASSSTAAAVQAPGHDANESLLRALKRLEALMEVYNIIVEYAVDKP